MRRTIPFAIAIAGLTTILACGDKEEDTAAAEEEVEEVEEVEEEEASESEDTGSEE